MNDRDYEESTQIVDGDKNGKENVKNEDPGKGII